MFDKILTGQEVTIEVANTSETQKAVHLVLIGPMLRPRPLSSLG